MADALTPEQLEIFRQMRDLPGGLIDAGKTVARGVVGQVAGGYAGLYDLLRGKGADAAANRVRDIEEGTRRDPETKAGANVLQKIGETIEPVSTALKENIADPVGKVSPVLGAALVALPEALPGPKGAKSAARAARMEVGPTLSGGTAVREATEAARAATPSATTWAETIADAERRMDAARDSGNRPSYDAWDRVRLNAIDAKAREAPPTPRPGPTHAERIENDAAEEAARMARNEATVARMRAERGPRPEQGGAWHRAMAERGPRPEGGEPVPGSTLDRQRERAEAYREVERRAVDEAPVPEVVQALRSQDTLPGVEPKTRQQLLDVAERRKREAQEAMSFEDTNRGADFGYDPITGEWRMRATEAPWTDSRTGSTRDARTGDRYTNIGDAYVVTPGTDTSPAGHVNFRRNVGDENAQRLLEKRENLESARTDLEAARREHALPVAKEEIAATTERIRQLREQRASTREPEAMLELEREIFNAKRGKPLLLGPESDRQVYRAAPVGPGSSPRAPRYTDVRGHFAELHPAATAQRGRRLEEQMGRVRDVRELDESSEALFQQMRSGRQGGQNPDWVHTLNNQNPGRADAPSAQTQQAEADWWRNNPDVIAKHGAVPGPPPPPPDPNAFKARTVNAFLREASQNPAMFEYGPDPKATDLRGIANEMSASAGGRKKTGGQPVEISWTGPGTEPTRGTKRGRLGLEVPNLGEISASFGSDGKAHILATEGGEVGALLYQILNNHARKQGYTIEGDSLYNVNKLRVSTNILAEGARQGGKLINPRDMRGTSAGNELPLPRGRTSMPEVWQAEQASARARIAKGSPERISPEPGVKGGDPYAVRFDPKAGFSVHGEPLTGNVEKALYPRMKELSPGLLSKNRDKADSTGVGAKTIMRNAVYEWLQTATPKAAREVAKNWKDYGSLFSVAGVTVGEVLKAANDAEERGGEI